MSEKEIKQKRKEIKMCKFNENEIIKYANDIINATFIEATLQDKDGNIIEQGLVNKDVIKGLLDLYQKEKEKNKTLETLLQGNLYQMYLYYKELASKYQANSVSKDKIREEIEELENEREQLRIDKKVTWDSQIYKIDLKISAYRELLEEE